ncbi:Hypothetical protein, putative [Bodo saltans]|uniref:Uncharacterized protein n=1 Tax=Bodo saltans TaxID=75058 RepID=A0A0S4JKX3_BODSA|nr:Hypothetical protein, putative [Bodo saltans]|eukprot:CUG92184.1 Hypothetical protein, putative [Bodo saltans]
MILCLSAVSDFCVFSICLHHHTKDAQHSETSPNTTSTTCPILPVSVTSVPSTATAWPTAQTAKASFASSATVETHSRACAKVCRAVPSATTVTDDAMCAQRFAFLKTRWGLGSRTRRTRATCATEVGTARSNPAVPAKHSIKVLRYYVALRTAY